MQVHLKARLVFTWLLAINLLLACASVLAYTQTELETFDNEPPIVKDLLERASVLVADDKDADAAWGA